MWMILLYLAAGCCRNSFLILSKELIDFERSESSVEEHKDTARE